MSKKTVSTVETGGEKMGLISDIMEQNAERWPVNLLPRIRQPAGEPAVVKRVVFCPLCNKAYVSENELEKHLAREHLEYHSHLRINDEVVEAQHISPVPIRTAVLVCHGTLPGKVKVVLGDTRFSFNVAPGTSLNLLGDKQLSADGVLRVSLQFGQFKPMKWTIRNSQCLDVDFQTVEQVIGQWQQEVAAGMSLDWGKMRAFVHSSELSSLEKQYISAMYDYLRLIVKNNRLAVDGVNDYPGIYSRLELIDRPLAHTACEYIAFKLNWFELLCNAPRNSCFYDAGMFYCSKDHHVAATNSWIDNNIDLWIDDSDQACLIATLDSLTGNKAQAETSVSRVVRMAGFINELNLRRKTQLLRARLNRRSNPQLARECYSEVLNVPLFEREAREFLNVSG